MAKGKKNVKKNQTVSNASSVRFAEGDGVGNEVQTSVQLNVGSESSVASSTGQGLRNSFSCLQFVGRSLKSSYSLTEPLSFAFYKQHVKKLVQICSL